MIDLQKANRQMIAERQALLQQIAALKFARVTLGVHTLSLIIDGLEQVEAQATAGDVESRQLLTRLDQAIKRVPALVAGIALPNGS